jgi:hypothetical protein
MISSVCSCCFRTRSANELFPDAHRARAKAQSASSACPRALEACRWATAEAYGGGSGSARASPEPTGLTTLAYRPNPAAGDAVHRCRVTEIAVAVLAGPAIRLAGTGLTVVRQQCRAGPGARPGALPGREGAEAIAGRTATEDSCTRIRADLIFVRALFPGGGGRAGARRVVAAGGSARGYPPVRIA